MILDTDILIDIQRRHPSALNWFGGLTDPPITCGFAAMELVSGCANQAELRRLWRFLADFEVVWPSESNLEYALRELASLRLAHGLGLVDSLIATTALGSGMPLATFNVRHFRSVPGLSVVSPYTR